MLEMILLLIIAEIFEMDEDTASVAFGGLDTQPRCTMAVNAARHFGASRAIVDGLKRVRLVVSKELAERRNQVVHAVPFKTDMPEATRMLMTRWKKELREREVSNTDLHQLHSDILRCSAQALGVMKDIAVWRRGEHRGESSVGDG
ncbi:MAG: hypothetical protein ABR588_00385 [Sphingomicrobium sp.]|nr:hypothetical protein [Sphingomonadales bacterium]